DNGGQVSVVDVAFGTDSIFALTSEGLKIAPLAGANLANYQNWENIGTAAGLPTADGKKLQMLGDSIFALFGDSVYKGLDGAWELHYADTNFTINSIKASGGKFYIL